MRVAFEPTLTCTLCGSPMLLRRGQFGEFYGCVRWPECDGIQKLGRDGAPRGPVTDKATRELRIKGHERFDRLWQVWGLRRGDAYARLAAKLGIEKDDCHFGLFDAALCAKATGVVEDLEREEMLHALLAESNLRSASNRRTKQRKAQRARAKARKLVGG